MYSEAVNRLSPSLFRQIQEVVDRNVGTVFPAIAVTVIYKGEIVYEAAWGWIDPDDKTVPVTTSAQFDLASLTKLFTETAFLRHISKGIISLDDPLVCVVPEFGEDRSRPIDGGQDPHTKEMLPTPHENRGQTVDPQLVSFRHLLTHTSGLAPWRAVYLEAGPAPPPPDTVDPSPQTERWSNALQALCRYPFVGRPGERVRYSDLGILLLGEALSRLHSNRANLEQAIAGSILTPLGLRSITYNPVRNGFAQHNIPPTEYDALWRQRRCWGEVHDENASGVGGVAGHAGLFGSAHDIALFGQAWLEHDARLQIDPQLMSEAATFQIGGGDTFRMGYGWMLRALEDSSAGDIFSIDSYGHTGFTGTSLWIDPKHHLVVACLTNRVYRGREKPGIHEFRRAFHDVLASGLYPV